MEMRNPAYIILVVLLGLVTILVSSCGPKPVNTTAVTAGSKLTAEQYLKKGISLSENETYEMAIQQLTNAISLEPKSAKAYFHRALAFTQLQKYAQAVDDLSTAIKLDPDNAHYYYERGKIYPLLADWNRAINDCSKAIQLNPQFIEAYKMRGLSWLWKKEYARAAADLLFLEPSIPDDILHLVDLAVKPGEAILMDLRCVSSGGHDCKGSYMPYTSVISTHIFVNPGDSGIEVNTINIYPAIEGNARINSPVKYFRNIGIEYLVVKISSRTPPSIISNCSIDYRKTGTTYFSASNEVHRIKVDITESSSVCPID